MAQQNWDFYPTFPGDWSILNGYINLRSSDSGGVTPSASLGGSFAGDNAHTTMLLESPQFWFDGTTFNGDTMFQWQTAGGAGDQQNNGPDWSNPADVLAAWSGSSNTSGEKGLAFLNTATGVYDAVLFKTGNGGTLTYNLTASDLEAAGIDFSQGYRLQYYENDQGSWGWGQLNYINLAAGTTAPGDLTWDGTANGNWLDPNWTGGPPAVPDANTTAWIGPNGANNTVTVTGSQAVRQLEMSGNAHLILDSGATLQGVFGLNAAANTVEMRDGATLAGFLSGGSIDTLTTAGDATFDIGGPLSVSGSTYSDQGIPAVVTKSGTGTLSLDNSSGTGVLASQTTFRVQEGVLEVTGTTALGDAGILLEGGTLRLNDGAVQGLNGSLFRNLPGGIPRDITYANLDDSTYVDTPGRVYTGPKANTILSIASEVGYDILVTGSTQCANNNDWGPFPTLSSDWENFITAYSGVFIPETSGIHTFRWSNDDRGLMYLDYNRDGTFQNSERLADYDWNGTGSVDLEAGTAYGIIYMAHEYGGGRTVNWYMTPPGGTEAIIDPSTSPGFWQANLGSPIDVQSTVTIDAPGGAAIQMVTGQPVNISDLVLVDGTLQVSGGHSLTVESPSIATTTSGSVGLQTDSAVTLGTVAGLNGNGQTATLTKTGAADLILNHEGTGLGNVTFDVQEGRLIGVHGSNPFASAALEVNGGELVLGTAGGDVTYDNSIHATGGVLTAGAAGGGVAGPATITVGSPSHDLTVAPGSLLQVRSTDGLSLDIAGQTLGGSFEFTQGDVKLSGGGTVEKIKVAAGTTVGTGDSKVNITSQLGLNGMTYRVNGGSFAALSDSLLDARTLELSGGIVTVALEGQERFTAADGALHNWRLDEANGATVAVDSIAGKNGTVNGNRVFGLGLIDNALLADGSGDYVTVPADGNPVDLPGNSFTISFWAKRDSTDERFMIGQGDSGSSRQSLHIGFRDADTFTFAFWSDDLNYDNASVIGDTDAYHHWVCTYDAAANRQEVWLDGVYVNGRDTGGDFVGSGTNDFWIGRRRDGKDYRGGLDDVWVFDHVLGGSDIATLYAAGTEGWRAEGGNIFDPDTDLLVTADAAFNADVAGSATFGDITLVGGPTLTLTGAPGGLSFSDVSGNGAITGDFLIRDSLHAGESPGIISLLGDVTLDGAVFSADVNGLIPGDEYSQVVLLGGALDISNATLSVETAFSTGILPGDSIMLINNLGGTVIGNFLPGATIVDANGVYRWNVLYEDGSVFIENSYIPEPTTLAILGLGLLAARRRRKG